MGVSKRGEKGTFVNLEETIKKERKNHTVDGAWRILRAQTLMAMFCCCLLEGTLCILQLKVSFSHVLSVKPCFNYFLSFHIF